MVCAEPISYRVDGNNKGDEEVSIVFDVCATYQLALQQQLRVHRNRI